MYDQDFIERALYKDEYIIWHGSPNPKRLIQVSDLSQIALIFVALWFMCSIIISSINPDWLHTPIIGEGLEIQMFLFIFFLLLFFALKQLKRYRLLKKSKYVFTNERFIVYFGVVFKKNFGSFLQQKNENIPMHLDEDLLIKKEPFIVLDRTLGEFDGINLCNNLYGGVDIIFSSSTSLGDLVFENVDNAELFRDIFKELKERKRGYKSHGKIHYL